MDAEWCPVLNRIWQRLKHLLKRRPGRARFIVLNRKLEPLAVFQEPDERAIENLEHILASMQIASGCEALAGSAAASAFRGNLVATTEVLRAALAKDYRETEEFTEKELRIRFEYRVQSHYADPRLIWVATRLYRTAREGSVSYGMVIQRIGTDEFIIHDE